MDAASDHIFNPKSASPALKQAMAELAAVSGRAESDLHGIRLGDAYALARDTFGANLPDFWRVWASWNDAPDEPAEWGEL